MKGISILAGAVIALGLGTSSGAYAMDEELEDVTMDFVLDDADDVDGVILSLEEHEAADREERENRSDGEDRREQGDGESNDGRFADGNRREAEHLADLSDHELESDRDEQAEGEVEDHDVEDALEHEQEHDGEEGIDEEVTDGDDIAGESELADEVGEEELVDEMGDEEIPAEDGEEAV